MTKIIAVRHAESVANTKGIYQGQTYDTDLSPLGKDQARVLAIRLKDIDIGKIISSPLKRTCQTALTVSKLVNTEVEKNELITETNHGLWEGKTKKWIEENYPDVAEIWNKRPGSASFPGGEAFVDTVSRVKLFLESYNFSESTLIVTHDNIIRIMACMGSNRSLRDLWKINIEPAALNFFELSANGRLDLKVIKLNDNEHLLDYGCDLSKHAL